MPNTTDNTLLTIQLALLIPFERATSCVHALQNDTEKRSAVATIIRDHTQLIKNHVRHTVEGIKTQGACFMADIKRSHQQSCIALNNLGIETRAADSPLVQQ